MARTKAPPAAKSTALAKAKPSSKNTSIATIDDELANFASNINEFVASASGNRIKIKPSGDFEGPGNENLGNEIQFVVINFVGTNKYYSQPYREGDPVVPDCYAIGHAAPMRLSPEPDSPHIQNDNCATCPLGGTNAFGSAVNGKGKACQNRYVLAGVLDDPNNPDAINDPDAPIYVIDLSPSNIKSFEGAVGTVARSLGGPPVKAILTLRGTAAGTYGLIDFGSPIPNPNYAMHWGRKDEVEALLMRKPDFAAAAAAAPASRSRVKPRTAARR